MKFLGRWYVSVLMLFLGLVGVYFLQNPLLDFLSDLKTRGGLTGVEDSGKKEFALTPTIDVTLFFGSSEGDMLVAIPAKVEEGGQVVQTLRHVLNALIDGPKSEGYTRVIPAGTKLRTLIPGAESTLYVDFDRTFREEHPGGAWTEMLTAQAVANTVLKNFGKVFERVVLLIDGQEALTVAGAYSISGPLRFRDDIVAKLETNISIPPPPERSAGVPLRPGPVGLPAESKSPDSPPEVPPVGMPSQGEGIAPVGAPTRSTAELPEAAAPGRGNPKP